MKRLVFILGLMVAFGAGTAQGGVTYPVGYESLDSPSTVVLPDCSTISVTTSYHGVAAYDELPIEILDLDNVVPDDTPACDGTLCYWPDGTDLSEDMDVQLITQRNEKTDNATPAKNGKGTSTVTCSDCPDDTVDALVTLAGGKKNHHFDLHLANEGTFVCKVGFNAHTQEEEL